MGLIDDFENDLDLIFRCVLFFEFIENLVGGDFVLFLKEFEILFEGSGRHIDFGSLGLESGFFLFLFWSVLLRFVLKFF